VRSLGRHAAGAAPAVLALYLLVRDAKTRVTHPFVATNIWVVLILLSWVGWGSVVAMGLFPRRRLDWGLRAALGMATVLAIGGVLGAARWVSSKSMVALVAVGLVALAFDGARFAKIDARRGWAFIRRSRPVTWMGLVFACGCLLVRVVGSVSDNTSNKYDDLISYFELPVQFLGSGTLDEPFSLHRILSLGGQPFLHAMVLARATVWNLHAVDGGLAYAVLFGLTLGSTRLPSRPWGVATTVGMALILALALKAHNIGSVLTGAVFFFTLYRLFDASPERDRPWATGAAVGLVAAAACTLRQNYALAVVAIVGVHFLWSFVSPLVDRRRVIREALGTAAAMALTLGPWLAFARRSSGTFFYPLVAGNSVHDFGLLGSVTKLEELRFFVDNVTFETPIGAGLTFAAIPFLLRDGRSTRAARTLFVGSLLGALGLIHTLRALDDRESLGRYYFAFAFAYALGASMLATSLASRPVRGASRYFAAGAVAVAAIVAHISGTHDAVRDLYEKSIAAWVDRRDGKQADEHPDLDKLYAEMQATVPPGQPMLVMLDEPFRLDFARNKIMNFDQPGAVSPGADLPIKQGEDLFTGYLLSVGVRYVAFRIDDSSPEFSRATWLKNSNMVPPTTRNGYSRGTLLLSMSYYYLDVFDNLTKLTTSRRKLFERDNYFVLDLKKHS
jgi:hypothetical protein